MPPLNSLKCVGERGKDESFSSQRRDPAKGARGRATRPLGSLRAEEAQRFPPPLAPPVLCLPAVWQSGCRSPSGETWGSANTVCEDAACGQGGEPTRGQGAGGCCCWVGRVSLADTHLGVRGKGNPAPGCCFRQESSREGAARGCQGRNLPLHCLRAAPLAAGTGRGTSLTLCPPG